MGCDGGTIPKRDELVRTKKKPEQVDKDAENSAKWKHCAISQEELRSPIVACELGRLYNKDAVIEHLLDKSLSAEVAKHVRNLKDVIELKLTENPAFIKDAINKGDEYMDHQMAPFICPVVGMEMNGKYKFCYIRGCGCVLSERAFKQVKAETCHKCGKRYDKSEITTLNGNDEEVKELSLKMEERRQKAKLEKKAKKHKANDETKTDDGKVIKKVRLIIPTGSKTESTSKANGKTNQKQIQPDKLENSKEKNNTTEAYKSLFTTHDSYKNQPKAHWITYNPLYN